jgi:hypothetical protein
MVDTDRLLPHSTTAVTAETDQHRNEEGREPDTGGRNRTPASHVPASTGVSSGGDTGVKERLKQPAGLAAVAAAVGGVAVFALAFFGGRLTAPAHAQAAPALTPVHGSTSGMSLPQLSEAAPVPPLAAKPKPQIKVKVRTIHVPGPTTTAAPVTAPKQKAPARKKAPSPVTIVGHG